MNGGSTRFDRIDALRTVAMLWMTVFHFCFDLNHFGLIDRQNFPPRWKSLRGAGIIAAIRVGTT